MNTLLSFTLGGVQDFVGRARSTRDVWNGSFLFSYLMYVATDAMLQEIAKAGGNREEACLLPALAAQPFERARNGAAVDVSVASFPNTVLLGLPPNAAPAHVFEKGRVALGVEWSTIVDACRKAFGPSGFECEQWDAQVPYDRVFEPYWSSVPADPRELRYAAPWTGASDFQLLFEAASSKLESRKMIRSLQQVGEEGYRCSLCGTRAALAPYGRAAGGGPLIAYTTMAYRWVDRQSTFETLLRPDERLCAVCVTRRLAPAHPTPENSILTKQVRLRMKTAPPNARFPSTASIAVADTLDRVLRGSAKDDEAQRAHLSKLHEAAVSAAGRNIEAEHTPRVEAAATAAGVKLLEGTFYYRDTYPKGDPVLSDWPKTFQPGSYIAVIVADGDRIGEHLKQTNSWVGLSEFSATLTTLGDAIRQGLETNLPGRVVYAGGDDVLAFVPAVRALDAMSMIFKATRRSGLDITTSIGCVIARHQDPLSAVLTDAHTLVKEVAKRTYGKDAFAIRRTSEGVTTGGGRALVKPCQDVLALMMAGKRGDPGLSGGLLPALAHRADGLALDGKADKLLLKCRRGIIDLAARRAWGPEGSYDPERAGCVRELYSEVASWRHELESTEEAERRQPAGDHYAWFLNLLSFLKFLARA